jgi:hypothetical protein
MDLRALARDKPCYLRIPAICNRDNKTTVLCHLKGWGWCGSIKPPDLCAVPGCSACHDVIDGRNTHHGYTRDQLAAFILRALLELLTDYAGNGIVHW